MKEKRFHTRHVQLEKLLQKQIYFLNKMGGGVIYIKPGIHKIRHPFHIGGRIKVIGGKNAKISQC